MAHRNHKRRRATAVVERDGRYLLVLDKGKKTYSLPGGGIEQGEPALAAATREVYEETGMEPLEAKLLFKYEGTTNAHRVVWVKVDGKAKVHLQRKELSSYLWWNPQDQSIPLFDYVKTIISRLRS